MNSGRRRSSTFKQSVPPEVLSPNTQQAEGASFQILYTIDDTFDKFQDIIIKGYIKDDCSDIDKTIEEYFNKKSTVLFAICEIRKQKDTFIQNHKEHWFTFGLVPKNGKITVFIKDSLDTKEYDLEKEKFKELIKAKLGINSKIDFVEHSQKEEYLVSGSDISIAFANLTILINAYKNENEKLFAERFGKMKFCTASSVMNNFDRLIVEIGLRDGFKFHLKPALQKILSALQRVTHKDDAYKLKKKQLMKLNATLENTNFSPRDQDKIDLRDIVIDLFVILKKRGQAFDEDTQKKIKKFFLKKNDRYIKKIDEIDETLRTDSRNAQVANELGLALNDRLTLLTNIRKLIPDLLAFDDLDILLKQFGDTNKQKTLENTRIQLECELNSTVDYDKAMDIIDELDNVRHELDYCARKVEASKMININDLIILLGHIVENAELSNPDKLSLGTLEKLVEVGKTTGNIDVSLAIIKIFKFIDMPKYNDIERTLDEILPIIPFDQRKLIEDLSRKLILREHPSLLKYFYRILIENEDKQARDDTLKLLKQCTVDLAYISEAIRLENKCLGDDSSIVDDCLKYVKKKNRLTLNCFEKLTKYFHMSEKLELVIEIIELEMQTLPKFFIEKCRDYIKSSSSDKTKTKNIIRITKSLVKSKQMSLKDIPNIKKCIEHYKDFDNDILDLLYAEYENGHDIPEPILDQLKASENNNEYARNLINLIEKPCGNMDILRNSRNYLKTRQNALENMIKEDQNYILDVVKLLQSLIKYDGVLRTDAFRALIAKLPKNFSKMNDFKIDLVEIGKSIENDQTISIDDITHLINKDPQNDNLAAFLPLIIDRIRSHNVFGDQTSEQALALLIGMSDVKQNEKLIYDKLPYLLEVCSSTIHDKVRESILKIIKNSIKESDQNGIQILKYKADGTKTEFFFPEELRKLECCQIIKFDADALENLRKTVQEEYLITKEKVEFLINVLINPDKYGQKSDVRSKISEILFEINLRQGLTSTNINQITEHTDLLKLVMVIGILAVSLSRNIQLTDEIINELWQQLLLIDEEKDQKLKKYLIYATVKIAAQKKSVSMEILKKIAILLEQKTETIEVRILCARILSKQIKQHSSQRYRETTIIGSLKCRTLEIEDNQDFLLNKLIFESLEKFIEENPSDDDWLEKYYNKIKKRLGVHPDELKPVDEFISSNCKNATDFCSNLEKFRLLCALNNTVFNRKRIDTSIFHEFHRKEWRKEILCSELLVETFKTTSVVGVDEFELENFRKYIRLLNTFTLAQDRKVYSIESLLQSLIEKQTLCQFRLEILNDVLLMLLESNKTKAWDIMMKDCNFQICLIELRELWLKKRLKQFGIAFHTEQLRKLNQYLPYRIKIINCVLDQLVQGPKIDELITFFVQLFNCGLTIESKEYFLTNEITNKISLKDLKLKLNEQLIQILLSKKFPSYAQYFHDSQNYHFRRKNTSFEQNAYNQAETTYWYKAEDIAIISVEWMKEFYGTNFRITEALGQQEDRNLSRILCDTLNEYKQDHRSTIIPLNVAGNHWVTLALIYNEKNKENIVLYKDSMGERHSVAERVEIQNILTTELKSVNFKFHRSCDQFDDYNCGVFTLANMKSMAENLSKEKQKSFIDNFEKWNFVTQKQAIELRHKQFPKMYALSVFQSYKQRKLVNYHSIELKSIKDLLEENKHETYPITIDETGKFENGLRISICLPKEENLTNQNNYQYLYVIEAAATILDYPVDFRQDSRLKEDIKHILKINEIYSTEKNVMKILDQQLISINQEKKRKLNPDNELINQISDDEIEEILDQVCVEITSTNKQILCMNIDLNGNNQIVDIKECKIIKKLHGKLIKILHSGWTLKSIQQIINHIDSKKDIERLFDALDPIYEYLLKEFDNNIKGKMLIDILTSNLSEDLTGQIHDLAIFQTFERSYDKNFQQLKEEILYLNRNQTIPFIDDKKITKEYKKVQKTYARKSVLYPNSNCIQQWSTSDIQQWTEEVKKSSHSVSHYEKIAVVMKAVENTSKFPVREIQLLSLLVLINSGQSSGRLVQINTGEGKTTIVAMLAAIKALEGHHVDVVTSSPELAKPQSIQLKEFYQQFNLTVSHNGKDLVDIKTRYTADIVYGAAGDFQGDILRDEYSKLGTRNGRKCDVAIVDEVDSMLIDGRNHIVMLSSQMPAMDHLEPLLAAIWIQIGEVAKYIQEINGKTYFIQQPDIFDDRGEVRSNIAAQAVEIKGSKEDFIKKCTEKHLRKLIRDVEHLSDDTDRKIPEKYPEIKIPKHLREFVIECQLTKWIDSAIHAKYRCHNEQHYLIKNGKITPVDASNTGIIQANMHWNNGLHQFLQIKHGAKISSESLTTNFISNVTYFRRYGSNLFGLTGTLGSEAAQTLLREIYNVDNVIIPPFRKKQYQELTPIIVNNEDDWYENIIESSMNKLNNERGVLIITKYIKEVEEIKNRLIKAGYDQSKIKTYRTGDESKILEEELTSGQIIIATNIAGRGTDIRADKIETYGGLHVLVTFLPPNERVEQQNVGRTSRTGNKGTGQFILLQQYENDYLDFKKNRDKQYENDYLDLKKNRDEQEETEIRKAKIEIDEVAIKDAVFEEFCKLLTQIDGNDDTQRKENKIKIRAVEDRFGIWLKMQESRERMIKEAMLQKFNIFKQEILVDNKNNNLIRNPCFHVLIGNECLKKKDAGKNQDAIKEFTKAIELDEHFQVNAYYNRGYARLAEYGNNCKQNKDEIAAAVGDFERARGIIEENLEPMLHVIQQASYSETLSEQLRHKMILFGIQKYTIELAIGIAREENGEIEVEYLEIEQSLPQDQDIRLYSEEIEEYKNNGFIGSFKIKGLKPIDWNAVIIIASLGIAQIVAGATLAVYTAGIGSAIGTALIAEGVSDLIIAVRSGIINRDFDWKSYGIQKAISLTVAIVCVGFGAMLDVAKTVVAGVTSIGQVMTTTVKAGWIIAAKAIGTGLAKGVAKELITQLIDHGVNKALMPAIRDKVMKRVEKPIQNALLMNNQVKEMLELDGKNRNSYYERLIKQKAMELLHSTKQESALKAITIGIAKGIATQKIAGFSAVMKTAQVVQALKELDTFVPNFIEKLNEAIDKIYKEKILDEKETQNHKKSEQQQHTSSEQKSRISMKEEDTQNYTSTYTPETSRKDIDLKNVPEPEQVQSRRENKSSDELSRALASNVSVNICNIIQRKLVVLVTDVGINHSMTLLTADLDRSLQVQIDNYQAERRIEFFQDGDRNNRIPNEFKHGADDPKAVKKVDDMVCDLKDGGEAGLPHLGSLSDETGRPIKVFDDKGQVIRIIGVNKDGDPIEVQYHKPTVNNTQGHWTLPGGKEPAINNKGKNNCLFNVIAEQTGKDPNNLRTNTANRMANNKENLVNQARDIERLERYKKDALTIGGQLIYRSLREDEDSAEGLKPRGEDVSISPRTHVADGTAEGSPYISTTADLEVAKKWANRTEGGRVAEIDTDKNPGLEEKMIDLTDPDQLKNHILDQPGSATRKNRTISNERVAQDATRSKEILVQGPIINGSYKIIYRSQPKKEDTP